MCISEDIGRIDLALLDWRIAAASRENEPAELAKQAIDSVEIIDPTIAPL